MPFNLSQTNDEAAAITAAGASLALWLFQGEPITHAIGLGILAGLGVLGYTGYSSASTGVAAAPAATSAPKA